MNPIEIFRAGTHTDSHGATLSFSEGDLASMAKAYDPALSEAPIVVGHPKADAPAYGWIKSLSAEGGRLFAAPDQVDPSFAEMVRAGRFKKLSASLYSPASPANPKPGAWYLRHVGFLGAQPPAIKGLAPVNFAAGEEEGTITVEFSEGMGLHIPACRASSRRARLHHGKGRRGKGGSRASLLDAGQPSGRRGRRHDRP